MSIDITNIDEVNNMLKKLERVPEDIKVKALDTMAKEAAEKIKNKGEAMHIRDDESNVHVLDTIITKKPKITQSGGYADITFKGTRLRGNTKPAMLKLLS